LFFGRRRVNDRRRAGGQNGLRETVPTNNEIEFVPSWPSCRSGDNKWNVRKHYDRAPHGKIEFSKLSKAGIASVQEFQITCLVVKSN